MFIVWSFLPIVCGLYLLANIHVAHEWLGGENLKAATLLAARYAVLTGLGSLPTYAAPLVGDWAPRRAWFKLSLLHPSGDEARHSSKEATHSFAPAAVDWGFTSFLPLADVRAEFVHADGSVVVRCELSTDPSVVPPEALPPGGVLGGYLGNQHSDCRRETGHGERSFWCVWRKRESERVAVFFHF